MSEDDEATKHRDREEVDACAKRRRKSHQGVSMRA